MDEILDTPVLPDDIVNPPCDLSDTLEHLEVSFNIDYYKSHCVPTRHIIELKKANE